MSHIPTSTRRTAMSMRRSNPCLQPLRWLLSCLLACGVHLSGAVAQDASAPTTIEALEQALGAAKQESSSARHRLAVRRVIRDAEGLLAARAGTPQRFVVLEFLFRAQQQLITLDDDAKHRQALLETCRELVKAPDDMAGLRLEADLLLSQADLARQGADAAARANALRPFVGRYIDTPEGARVLRMALVMALELGDSRVITDLQEKIVEYFPADLEMIAFQRDKLGGQVIGAPLSGVFERSDGRKVRFPMDVMGRSTLLLFWSRDEYGLTMLKDIAAAASANRSLLEDRLDIVSFNLDDLPDAGESIVRGLGVDWQVLRLPGGKGSKIYDAFVREDPRMLSISPTGYSALVMSGSSREKKVSDGTPDYARMFGSNLSRTWNDPHYKAQLTSLMIGEFLVIDPEGGLDPARPPEMKSLAMGAEGKTLSRDDACVPEPTLKAIQDCLLPPPSRYRLTPGQACENYQKAEELCRKAIAEHARASDLWLVRNRLIIARLGLWKTRADLNSFETAVEEARAALAAGYPEGCDLVARLCLARAALRDPASDPGHVLEAFLAQSGGDNASGPCLAAASLLALDVGDRRRFELYRKRILQQHTETPVMWTFTAFLLDRHHAYWLFQEPFTAGWSFGRREQYAKSKGDMEEAQRFLKAELRTLDGQPFRIPEDLDGEWTAILFARPGPWSSQRDDGLPPSPLRALSGITAYAAARPGGGVSVLLATLGGEPEAIRAQLETQVDPKRKKEGITCPVLVVPGGVRNPLTRRLGLLPENDAFNSVLLRKDGRIALCLSGLAAGKDGAHAETIANVIERADEAFVRDALGRGDVQAAKERMFALAPPFDPNAVDEKGRKLKPPVYGLAHLRARARVYMALKEWDKALADASEVVERQLGKDGGMSLRTDELDQSEALKEEILRQIKPNPG